MALVSQNSRILPPWMRRSRQTLEPINKAWSPGLSPWGEIHSKCPPKLRSPQVVEVEQGHASASTLEAVSPDGGGQREKTEFGTLAEGSWSHVRLGFP